MTTETKTEINKSTDLFRDLEALTSTINLVRQKNADTESKPHPAPYVYGIDNASIATSTPSLMAVDAAAQILAYANPSNHDFNIKYCRALSDISNWNLTEAEKAQVCIQAHLAWRAQQPLIPDEQGEVLGRLKRGVNMNWSELSDVEKFKDELRIRNAATVLHEIVLK